jgi:DNA helicase-2/ATP-dependent DNA helicase PcrA
MSTASPPTIHAPDASQQQVITSSQRSIRVIAPAGSGKTETLAHRVGHLIDSGISPSRILILTFDTQARSSFQRALSRLGIPGNVEIRTLNAFGLSVLTNQFSSTRSRTSQVFHGSAEPLLSALVDQADGMVLTGLFGTLKSHLFDPQHLNTAQVKRWVEKNYRRLVPERYLASYPEETNAKEFAIQLRREFLRYEEQLEARNVIDFEDQKLRALTLLQQNPDLAERIQDRYDEVIVDEVQDINPLDQALIELIARKASLVITGDDDQAIYGFRWASADYLIRPDKPFSRAFTSYELHTNYRCPKSVLDRSTQLIRQNRNRVAKTPRSGVSAAGTIELVPAADRLAGSRQIVNRLKQEIEESPGLDWSDIAILARRNQHLDEIQVQLIASGIPHTVKSGRDLIQTWASALALLDLATALREKGLRGVIDLRPAISSYTWFPKIIRVDMLNQFNGLTLSEVILALQPQMQSRGIQGFENAIALLLKQKNALDELKIIETRFLGFDSSEREGQDSGERPLELLRTILNRRDSTRDEAIERLRGFIDRSSETNSASGPRVELATYHGAKGRQWHTVVLPWVSSAIAPDPLTRSEFGEMEAERRLFYVAMTRSSHTLIVGHPASTSKEWNSRFLYEAGLVERPREEAKPKQAALPTPNGSARVTATVRKTSTAPISATPATTRTSPAKSASARATRSAATSPKPARSTKTTGPKPAASNGESTTYYVSVKDIERLLKWIEQHGGATIDYSDSPELLFPLQLALLLEGIPYKAPANHDLLHSWVLRELYKHVTKSRLRIIRAVEEPEYPAYGTAYPGMVTWLRHKGLAKAAARDALDTAIEQALASRRGRNAPIVTFKPGRT